MYAKNSKETLVYYLIWLVFIKLDFNYSFYIRFFKEYFICNRYKRIFENYFWHSILANLFLDIGKFFFKFSRIVCLIFKRLSVLVFLPKLVQCKLSCLCWNFLGGRAWKLFLAGRSNGSIYFYSHNNSFNFWQKIPFLQYELKFQYFPSGALAWCTRACSGLSPSTFRKQISAHSATSGNRGKSSLPNIPLLPGLANCSTQAHLQKVWWNNCLPPRYSWRNGYQGKWWKQTERHTLS